jgi:hypothetical protein
MIAYTEKRDIVVRQCFLNSSSRNIVLFQNTNDKSASNCADPQPKPDGDIISTIPVISEFTQENNEKGGKR